MISEILKSQPLRSRQILGGRRFYQKFLLKISPKNALKNTSKNIGRALFLAIISTNVVSPVYATRPLAACVATLQKISHQNPEFFFTAVISLWKNLGRDYKTLYEFAEALHRRFTEDVSQLDLPDAYLVCELHRLVWNFYFHAKLNENQRANITQFEKELGALLSARIRHLSDLLKKSGAERDLASSQLKIIAENAGNSVLKKEAEAALSLASGPDSKRTAHPAHPARPARPRKRGMRPYRHSPPFHSSTYSFESDQAEYRNHFRELQDEQQQQLSPAARKEQKAAIRAYTRQQKLVLLEAAVEGDWPTYSKRKKLLEREIGKKFKLTSADPRSKRKDKSMAETLALAAPPWFLEAAKLNLEYFMPGLPKNSVDFAHWSALRLLSSTSVIPVYYPSVVDMIKNLNSAAYSITKKTNYGLTRKFPRLSYTLILWDLLSRLSQQSKLVWVYGYRNRSDRFAMGEEDAKALKNLILQSITSLYPGHLDFDEIFSLPFNEAALKMSSRAIGRVLTKEFENQAKKDPAKKKEKP